MKYRWKVFLITMLLIVSITYGNTALAEGVSLNRALTMVDSSQNQILLNDDFSMYDWLTSDLYTINEGKFIILYRIGPEKEFTISSEPFPDEFNGIDIGKPTVYLDIERMKLIPEEYRAKTADEVGNIIMLESFYTFSAEISEYVDNGPDTLDLMEFMLAEQQNESPEAKVPSERTDYAYAYKPAFDGKTAVTLYNAENGTCASFSVRTFPYAELRDNPIAADITDVIYALGNLYNACATGNTDIYTLSVVELLTQDALEPDHRAELIGLFSDVDFNTIQNKSLELIWKYAEKLRETDTEHSLEYSYMIDIGSLEGLYLMLDVCSYSSVSKSDTAIIQGKDYLGEIDLNTLENMWQEAEETMEIIGWNPAYIEMLLDVE